MLTIEGKSETPWEIVLRKFGMSQNAMSNALNFDRSKISRSINHNGGKIDAHTQVRLLKLARDLDVDLQKGDLIPSIPEPVCRKTGHG